MRNTISTPAVPAFLPFFLPSLFLQSVVCLVFASYLSLFLPRHVLRFWSTIDQERKERRMTSKKKEEEEFGEEEEKEDEYFVYLGRGDEGAMEVGVRWRR